MAREFDIIVYGATGFTGRLVAEYLSETYPSGVKWAMAGRSLSKLQEVRDLIGAPADITLIAANSDDPASLKAMCERATAVITTVGPYQLYGSDLVAACAEAGTAYLDLCGEPAWMRHMSLSSALSAIFSCAVRPNARAISRLPAGVSDEAMKSRICCRVGRPGLCFGFAMPTVTCFDGSSVIAPPIDATVSASATEAPPCRRPNGWCVR